MKKAFCLVALVMAFGAYVVGCGSGNNNNDSCQNGQVMSSNNGCVSSCANGGIIGGYCQALSAPAVSGNGGCNLPAGYPSNYTVTAVGNECCPVINGQPVQNPSSCWPNTGTTGTPGTPGYPGTGGQGCSYPYQIEYGYWNGQYGAHCCAGNYCMN